MLSLTPHQNRIETIYNLTKDGYNGSFSKLDSVTRSIVTHLVKKGVLVRTPVKRGKGKCFSYHWRNGLMSPTPLFCKTIIKEMGLVKSDKPIVTTEAPKPTVESKTLADFSIQELWDEMKSRGAMVQNGKLVVLTELQ